MIYTNLYGKDLKFPIFYPFLFFGVESTFLILALPLIIRKKLWYIFRFQDWITNSTKVMMVIGRRMDHPITPALHLKWWRYRYIKLKPIAKEVINFFGLIKSKKSSVVNSIQQKLRSASFFYFAKIKFQIICLNCQILNIALHKNKLKRLEL